MTLNLEVLFPEINIPQRIRLSFLLSLYDSFVTLNLILIFGEDKLRRKLQHKTIGLVEDIKGVLEQFM